MRVLLALAAAASCVGLGLCDAAAAGDAAYLAAPVAVSVGGVPIDRADDRDFDRDDNRCPWVGDFDGDGKLDLLVGQSHRGKLDGGYLRIYRNQGGKAEPRLAEPVWFHDKVPTGVTPIG
jgi:hypothetical protein